MSRLYDITPIVSPDLKVWPGDTPMSREVLLDMGAGANITLSTLRATVHLGAHADAPNHYAHPAEDIAERSLEPYLGPCQVVTAEVERGQRFGASHVSAPITEPRVLFRTGSFPDPNRWNEDFAAFDPDYLDQLAASGVRLVGIDTPSVDLFPSKDLPAHQSLHRHDLSVLEGIVLGDVPDGRYELIALPLKLAGFDASPVRAVLREL